MVLALLILASSLVGWFYVFFYGVVLRTDAPSWALPLADASSAVALALFGTLIGIKEMRLHVPTPQIDVRVVREDAEQLPDTEEQMNLSLTATLSIHPGQAPITVRTFKGVIEPLWEKSGVISQPILLKPDPTPIEVSVQSFNYVATFVPAPSEGAALRLMFFLVTDNGTTTHVVKVMPRGYREPGWFERRRDARWLRRQERERRIRRDLLPE